MSTSTPEPYLTAGALAKALGMGRERVRTLTLAGVFTAYQPGGGVRLYLESEARAAIAARVFSPSEDWREAAEAAALRVMKQQGMA